MSDTASLSSVAEGGAPEPTIGAVQRAGLRLARPFSKFKHVPGAACSIW